MDGLDRQGVEGVWRVLRLRMWRRSRRDDFNEPLTPFAQTAMNVQSLKAKMRTKEQKGDETKSRGESSKADHKDRGTSASFVASAASASSFKLKEDRSKSMLLEDDGGKADVRAKSRARRRTGASCKNLGSGAADLNA